MRVGSSNSCCRLAQRRPAARSSNQSRSAAVPPRASCWRRHCNTSVPPTVVQSLKAEAYASAIQIHTAVRADIQAPKAGGPAQRGSTANEAPADQSSPLSQWPPSTVDACRVTPLTSTGPRQWKRADPQGESRQSHHPEAGHCCPDRTNGGHPPEPLIWGTASGSPSGPKSMLRCVADTPPPRAPGQRPPTNGSAPRSALGAHGSRTDSD